MKLSLNIYADNGKDVVKVYETDETHLLFGVVEDIFNLIDIDILGDESRLEELALLSVRKVKPILKNLFSGITDEEIAHTRTEDVVPLAIQVIVMSLSEIKDINGTTGKNLAAAGA